MLRSGVVSCVVLLILVACGGGSSQSSTSTATGATSTTTAATTTAVPAATSTATPTAQPATPTPTVTPPPTSTPLPTATPRSTATATATTATGATPGAGLVTGSATPQPTDKVKAQLAEGVTSDYQAVKPSTVFSTSTPKIYLVFTTTDLPDNSSLDTVWIAIKVDANVAPNYEIDRAHLAVHGSQSGDFSLTAQGTGFPSGSYKVDLFLNGTLIASYPYEVK